MRSPHDVLAYENTSMSKFYHPLLALIASATESELAKYVEYLKRENQVLRARLPKRIHTTTEERKKLLEVGKGLGKAIEQLISIVSPSTFSRWLHEDSKGTTSKEPKGRPRKNRDIRELVLTIAKETGFGYTRIVGEMTKLGIRIGRSTVRNILMEEGISPVPDRKSEVWSDFLDRHGDTLWACDFFSVKTITSSGLRKMYMLVFLCVKTREVYITPSTRHPKSAWVSEETKRFLDGKFEQNNRPKFILHDRDTKFSKAFVKSVTETGTKAIALPVKSPNLNGRCERVIGTLKGECLHRFLIFGKQHLDYLVKEFSKYYNHTRSHSSRECLPPIREAPETVESLSIADVEVRSHVGGLVKSFERRAA